MFKKGSKIASMISGTCPRCQKESMYSNTNPYAISETMKMHDHCSHCGLTYKMEPNFFFGAMYVSYGLSVIAGIVVFLISHYGFKATIGSSFEAIVISLIVLMPLITRISRNIYINIFVNFDKSIAIAVK